MSKLDIIALVLITIHSFYRAAKPKAGKESRSPIVTFILTFLKDALIYFIVTFVIGLVLGYFAPMAILNFFKRS